MRALGGTVADRRRPCTQGEVLAMPPPNRPVTPRRPDEPMFLWSKVVEARTAVASQRRLPAGGSSAIARAELLSALEAYAVSLTNHRRPIPYTLRDELRLKRLTR